MDEEKYPKYFLGIFTIYFAMLITNLAYFVFPFFGAGFSETLFILIIILLILPLILTVLYVFDEKFHWIIYRENIIRYVISGLMLLTVIFTVWLLAPMWMLV